MYKVERNKTDIKIIALSFLIVLICLCGVILQVYGEPIILREDRNNFTDNKWFNSSDNVLHNATLGQYSLNASAIVKENFNNYTEVDSSNILTVNSSHVYFDGNMRYLDNEFVYKSYNTVNDFSYSFDIHISTIDDDSRTIRSSLLTLTNTTEDIIYHDDNNLECLTTILLSKNSVNKFYLGLFQWENGVRTQSYSPQNGLDVDTWYYLTLERVGNEVKLYVYSDSDRSTLVNTLTINVSNSYNYNKVMAVCNYGYATGIDSEGYVKDLKLGTVGYAEKGVLFFNNLLSEYNNRSAVWFLSNQTLNSNSLDVGFSSDNSSWVYFSLNECFESIFLEPYNYTDLYVRYNFTNGVSTPVLYNSSLLYESSTTIVNVEGENRSWWMIVFYISTPLLICLIIIMNRNR